MVALGRGVKEAQLKSGIERLVDLSGGRALFVERSDQLDEPFAEILEELSNQYIIGYESKNTARNGALARSEARDSRHQLQRARAPGLSRAGIVSMRAPGCIAARAIAIAGALAIARAAAQQPPHAAGAAAVVRDQGRDRARRRQRRRSRREAGADADAGATSSSRSTASRARSSRCSSSRRRRPTPRRPRRASRPTPRTKPQPPDACCCSSSTKAACASARTAPILRTAQSLFDRLAPGDLVGLARLPTGVGGVEFTADRKRITDGLMRVTGAASTPHRHDAHQHQRSLGAREQRPGHVPERGRPRMRRHDRRRSRCLPRTSSKPTRARCCSRPARRARATLQSLEALLQEPRAAQDAGQHRDDVRRHVRGARSRRA